MSRTIPCAFVDACPCTHTGTCVAGWLDDETDSVTTPCPICRPDLYREMAARHHRRGDDSTWIRREPRPMTSNRGVA